VGGDENENQEMSASYMLVGSRIVNIFSAVHPQEMAGYYEEKRISIVQGLFVMLWRMVLGGFCGGV